MMCSVQILCSLQNLQFTDLPLLFHFHPFRAPGSETTISPLITFQAEGRVAVVRVFVRLTNSDKHTFPWEAVASHTWKFSNHKKNGIRQNYVAYAVCLVTWHIGIFEILDQIQFPIAPQSWLRWEATVQMSARMAVPLATPFAEPAVFATRRQTADILDPADRNCD